MTRSQSLWGGHCRWEDRNTDTAPFQVLIRATKNNAQEAQDAASHSGSGEASTRKWPLSLKDKKIMQFSKNGVKGEGWETPQAERKNSKHKGPEARGKAVRSGTCQGIR